MKLCPNIPNIYCPFFIFRSSLLLLVFSFCGFPLVFYSVNAYFDIQIKYGQGMHIAEFYQILPLYFSSFFSLSFGIYLLFLMLKILINHFPSSPKLANNPYMYVISIVIGIIATAHIIGLGIFTLIVIISAELLPILGAITALTAPLIIYVIGLLLSKLLKSIPFFDDFLNWLNWLSAIIIAISLSFIFIAITWINYLPILSVALIIMAIGNLYFLIPAHRLLIVPNYEPPEPPLVQETVVPQKV